ncbi:MULTISPECIES: MerR family transcriptional regulator [Rhizobium]|uniref:Phage terminase Nu1 subunit (DNA packaging protein) n=2 Tax=Rhizobium TaxID=379 RepID=A0A7W8XVI1_9HYPH|nr:MerR family transcriptional regulator [Rhizobium paranaense]MBB5576370.1 phage terminase Nu1 subunit (DNA packaging protein) [Rhizobium paranaense]
MAKSYPDELRMQVIAYLDEGHTVREAAEKFSVSASFAAKAHKKHSTAAETTLFAQAEAAASEPEDASNGEMTAAQLADLLGVSKRAISDFVERGIVVKTDRNRFDMAGSVQRYCEHLRMMAAGRTGDGSDALTAERARLAREQADQTALKNAALRRELIAIVDVRNEWTSIGRRIRNGMLSVPSRCRQKLPHLTTYDVDLIDREIRSALTELGNEDDGDSTGDIEAGAVGQSASASEAAAIGLD